MKVEEKNALPSLSRFIALPATLYTIIKSHFIIHSMKMTFLLLSFHCRYKAKVLKKPRQLIREHYKVCTFRQLPLREKDRAKQL